MQKQEFVLVVDGQHFADFKYRTAVERVQMLDVQGDVQLLAIRELRGVCLLTTTTLTLTIAALLTLCSSLGSL